MPEDSELARCKCLQDLGSPSYQKRYAQDILGLCTYAQEMGFIPAQLSVSRDFLEVSCCQVIKEDLNISDWRGAAKSYGDQLSFLLTHKLKEILNNTAKRGGFIGNRNGLDVFYDPDQEYMALYSIDPNTTVSGEGPCTGDGFSIVRISYKSEDIVENSPH